MEVKLSFRGSQRYLVSRVRPTLRGYLQTGIGHKSVVRGSATHSPRESRNLVIYNCVRSGVWLRGENSRLEHGQKHSLPLLLRRVRVSSPGCEEKEEGILTVCA